MALLLIYAMGELREPCVRQQDHFGGDVYVAALARLSRDTLGHEG